MRSKTSTAESSGLASITLLLLLLLLLLPVPPTRIFFSLLETDVDCTPLVTKGNVGVLAVVVVAVVEVFRARIMLRKSPAPPLPLLLIALERDWSLTLKALATKWSNTQE